MNTKKWIPAILIACVLFLLTACQPQTKDQDQSLAQVKESGKLVIATETGFPPFVFKTLVNGKDTIVGSDVEMAKTIADKLGVEATFSEMSFDNVLTTVQSGKAQMGISGISVTKEREKVFDFSIPYYTAKNTIVIQKSDTSSYTGLENFNSLSVGAQKGSIQEGIVKDQLPDANLVSLAQTGEMINQLKSGKLAAIILEEPIAKGYIAKNTDLAIAEIELDSSGSDAYAIALPKGSTALKKEIDTILQELLDTGEIEKMIQEAYELSIQE
ncbi:transporter substrate-binding domain-containing protein [Streptococcus cameli]